MDYNIQNKNGQTVLHLISLNSTLTKIDIRRIVIEMLLDHGANPTIEDNNGFLPVEDFKDPEKFDPTCAFLLVRSMVTSGA